MTKAVIIERSADFTEGNELCNLETIKLWTRNWSRTKVDKDRIWLSVDRSDASFGLRTEVKD